MATLFSHTDRTLRQHLDGLKNIIDTLLPLKTQFLWEKEDLKVQLYNLIVYHDIGKASDFFQIKIAEAIKEKAPAFYAKYKGNVDEIILKNKKLTLLPEFHYLSRHALFGAFLSQSLFQEKPLELNQLLLFEVIRRHHGDLDDFSPAIFTEAFDGQELNKILEMQLQHFSLQRYQKAVSFMPIVPFEINQIISRLGTPSNKRQLNKIIRSLTSVDDIKPFLRLLFLYSLLLSADKGDVMLQKKDRILGRVQIPDNVIDKYKKRIPQNKPIDKLREDAYNIILKNLEIYKKHNFFSITLPTGMGKTFAAYKAALKLKQDMSGFRVIYCLPFTSIIDQNGSIFSDILEYNGISKNLITIHHHLAAQQKEDKEGDELEYQEAEYVTEGWENEIIITTFVQLFESIFTNRNRLLRKFHNLCNSIIILDEIQNIPPKYIEAIEMVFRAMAEYFNTKFLFVTATQPIIVADSVIELSNINGNTPKFWFNKLDRIIIDQSLLSAGQIKIEQLLNDILDQHKKYPDKSILVICNTKAFSQRLYEILLKDTDEINCEYLSAALIPYHRKKVIEKIKNRTHPMIVVSTQVVEAGVDIDFDIVYREMAPMDSINQAAGRCNRNAIKEKGQVKLFDAGKKSIYDSTLMMDTQNILAKRKAIIHEAEIYELNCEYFQAVYEHIQKDNDKSQNLMRLIYGLQLQQISHRFRIIEQDYVSNAFFIPVNKEAICIWNKYIKCFEIEDHFKRKAEIRDIMPDILQYSVNIPEYLLKPSEEEEEKAIIKRDNWQDFYNSHTGYKIQKKKEDDTKSAMIF